MQWLPVCCRHPYQNVSAATAQAHKVSLSLVGFLSDSIASHPPTDYHLASHIRTDAYLRAVRPPPPPQPPPHQHPAVPVNLAPLPMPSSCRIQGGSALLRPQPVTENKALISQPEGLNTRWCEVSGLGVGGVVLSLITIFLLIINLSFES